MFEQQDIEWKTSWRDEYLKWICAFANTKGGKLYIGINDKGEIIGINNPKKLLEELPNKVRNLLGIIVGITLKKEENKVYLEIDIEAYPFPVSYKGQYHVRSGSTKQELKGSELDKFHLKETRKTLG